MRSIGPLVLFILISQLSCEDPFDPSVPVDNYTHTNKLSSAMEAMIDSIVNPYMEFYKYISVGLIQEAEPILVRSYGEDRLDKSDVYASVSKPLTATICMMMIEEGKISSVEDWIDDYSEKYKDAMPLEYSGNPITFQQLLSHESGIPHHERIWEDGKLALAFPPGTGFLYSTRGYGVLGEILEEMSGSSFSKLLEEYIAAPIEAESFSVPDILFEAPGGLISSTINDMAMFACGIMDQQYLSDSTLYRLVWKQWANDQEQPVGLGWYLNNLNSDSLAVYHAGSNGKPRAFIALRPKQDIGLVLQGRQLSSDGDQLFYSLSKELMAALANQ